MGREIKRVPVDFDWPLNKTWEGNLMPDRLHERQCPTCKGSGYSREANHLHDQWYDNAPFRPEDRGSTPFTPDHPAVRAFAERNVAQAPEFYGTSEAATRSEAQRLARHFNNGWLHHLNADDVAALVAAGRLMDFTHTFDPVNRWQPKDPCPTPTPTEVNEWSIRGFGHDSINAGVAIKARCEREGLPHLCADCGGHGSTEAYPRQRAEAEAWEPAEPPTGDGWQLWETVSEGSPISPVFPTADGLIDWMTTPAAKWGATGPWTREQAAAFVNDVGWAPSFMSSPETGLVDGVTGMTARA